MDAAPTVPPARATDGAAGTGSLDEPVVPEGPAGPEAQDDAGPGLARSLSQRARSLARDLGQAGRYMTQGLRLMVGLPDYDAYLNHMERTHPGQPVMSYEAFFRERQDARYSGKLGKCC